ncbi:family with sequence similarity 213, member B [Elysia marginata]|uniref:Family with sequence similarity 213, member B n=1 Tax=Elysia marginata TaxID=1093978 RepID=A0AAV4J5C4_9GAST|nr:family with sequence similarity 213, member B [Elysia marginata]
MSVKARTKGVFVFEPNHLDALHQWFTVFLYLCLKPVFYVLFVALDTLNFFIEDSSRHPERMDPSKIAKNQVKKVSSGEMVTIESFWQSSPVVLVFLRRFG